MATIPPHTLQESPNCRSITISDWTIAASTNPISNAQGCDALASDLGFPIPEMTFGRNFLSLLHRPSGTAYAFTTAEALKQVKNGELGEGDGGVKVGYADKWMRSRQDSLFKEHYRTDPSSTVPMPATVLAKPYDWTYTTTYPGHQAQVDASADISSMSSPDPLHEPTISWKPADPENPSNAIPLAELSRPDPIIFYAEIPLFEDELHDNGSSSLLVRIRVMPTCFFVLSRFTLRVDNVLFRNFDTRIYHSFSSSPPLIVREIGGWEAPYERVQTHLPRRDDLTPLTDPTFIAKVLTELPKFVSQKEGAQTGWRALGTRTEIAQLN